MLLLHYSPSAVSQGFFATGVDASGRGPNCRTHGGHYFHRLRAHRNGMGLLRGSRNELHMALLERLFPTRAEVMTAGGISSFALQRRPRVRLSVKRASCRSSKPRVFTGNSGERSGEISVWILFLKMFFDSGIMGLRPTKVMKNGSCSATTVPQSTAPPFVISTEAQRGGEICGLAGHRIEVALLPNADTPRSRWQRAPTEPDRLAGYEERHW